MFSAGLIFLTISGAGATPGNQTGVLTSIQPSCSRAGAVGNSSATPTEAISDNDDGIRTVLISGVASDDWRPASADRTPPTHATSVPLGGSAKGSHGEVSCRRRNQGPFPFFMSPF
jgi:hypothetical protein